MHIRLSHRLVRHSQADIDFEIDVKLNSGDSVIGLFGRSGTGKSTFLKLLAGLLNCADYKLEYADFSFSHTKTSRVHAKDNPCVYLAQESELFAHMNVRENLEWVCKYGQWRKKTAGLCKVLSLEKVIALCKLEPLLLSAPAQLSSGEGQRVSFARAILSAKPILLLDEAFSALDWEMRLYMHSVLQTLVKEYQFRCFLVSHSLEELSLCCKTLLQLHEGSIIRQGSTNEVLEDLYSDVKSLASRQLFSVLQAEYSHQDEQDSALAVWQLKSAPDAQMLYVKSSDEHIRVPRETAKFIVHANKVSISTHMPQATSMLNIIAGQVESIVKLNEGNLLNIAIQSTNEDALTKKTQTLRAFVTNKSRLDLKLHLGQSIFAMFKAL